MKHFLSWLLLLTISITNSQNSLHGNIKDLDSGQGIAFVNIYIPQLEKGTISDENGVFSLQNLPNGTYKVIFSIIGYETLSQSVIIPNPTDLNILLSASAIEMESIIISTPFHKLQSDNVMKVEQNTVKELKASGAATLSEGITTIAGVESVTTGLSIGKPVIRGLSSNRVLVYTQGIRLENQQFGDEHGLGISDSGIESVEVIKGPASLLYGSDALGGVLYLNPERFADEKSATGDVSANYYTNSNGFSTNAGFKTSGENFKFIIRGGLAEHSDYATAPYRVTNTRFNEKDFKTGIGYQSTNFKTEFRYNFNTSKLGIPEEIGDQNTHKTPLLPYQNIDNHILSTKSNFFFNKSNIDVNLGYIFNDRKEYEEEILEGLSPALQMKLKTFSYDLKYHFPELGKFETIVGIQGMSQTNTNYGEEQLIPDATSNDFGVLATSHIHFEKSDVQIGLRYDNRNIDVRDAFNKNFNSFNSAVGIKLKLLQKLTTRLNLATGFRAPNLAELTSFGVHEGTNRFEIGNAELNNEQNFQVDLSLEYKNEHFEIYANPFYNSVNDYIFLSPNGDIMDDAPVFEYTQSDAKLYGGEFGMHIHPHPLDWLHFESSFETVTGKQNNDTYLPLIPAHALTNIIRIEFKKDWLDKGYAFVKLKSTFAQTHVSTFETSTNSYGLWSLGLGGEITVFNKVLSLNITGNNLSDKKYINHLSRLKPEGIYNMGRNISFGITYNL